MEKTIIWGNERIIKKIINKVKRFEETGDIQILGICLRDTVSENPETIFSHTSVSREFCEWSKADCVLVCTDFCAPEDIREAEDAGASREQLIPCQLLDRNGFSFSRYRKLLKSRISIFSNICWGGHTYHYFRLPFLSPTINLFFTDIDYIMFLENLDRMLEAEPVLTEMEYNKDEDFHYPVFSIDGVKLHLNHCQDMEQGLNAWNRRKKRVNRDNMLVMMKTESVYIAKRFDSLPFRKKICFVPFQLDLPSCVYVNTEKQSLIANVLSYSLGGDDLYDRWVLLEDGKIVYTVERDVPQTVEIDIGLSDMIHSCRYILIYGAWMLGTKAFDIIRMAVPEKMYGFAVTAMDGNLEEKSGYPVNSVENWTKILSDRNILPDQVLTVMALNACYYNQIRIILRKDGFNNMITYEDLELFYYELKAKTCPVKI